MSSSRIYQDTCDLFDQLAEDASDNFWTLATQSRDKRYLNTWDWALPIQKELFIRWFDYQDLVSNIIAIVSYLERYHVIRHNLPSLRHVAYAALGNKVARRVFPNDETSAGQLATWLRPDDADCFSKNLLLLLGAQACQHVLSFPLGDDVTADAFPRLPEAVSFLTETLDPKLLPHLALRLKGAHQKAAMRNQEFLSNMWEELEKNPLTVVAMPEKERLQLPVHLVKSSTFLSSLVLKGGDVIMMRLNRVGLIKAIEFCEMDSTIPLPELPRPLPSIDINDFIPANYVSGMDQTLLFEVVKTANLFGLKSLLDLCCLQISVMVRGKSVEELRAMFNII